MHAGREARLVDAGQLLDLIERALRLAGDPVLRRRLCILRAEIRTHGLGLAHTHTRLNARQLHNAIRKTVGMDHAPDDPSHRLSYLNAISALIDQAQPVRINFGSLLLEKATAKRTFMIIAQLLKYVDATQPIRFLIAECETGFTLLAALYFARLFGVEDKVEISPLFETRVALEQGSRVIAEALGVTSFRPTSSARAGFASRPASPTPAARSARSPRPTRSSACDLRSAASWRVRAWPTSSSWSSTPMAN